MSKVIRSLLIYIFTIVYLFSNIYKPDVAIAATDSEVILPVDNCQGVFKGKVIKATLSREPAIDWPMNLTVDIATSVPHKYTYYGLIVFGGSSKEISLNDLTAQSSPQGNFYRLVFPMPIMRLEGNHSIRLIYSTKDVVCDFGKFSFGKAGGDNLKDISCTIKVPDHIKYGTGDLIIETTVTPFKRDFYKLYILKGDAGRLTRQIFDFGTVPPDQAIDRSPLTRWTRIGANESVDIINETQEIFIPEIANLDMGEKISFVIEAKESVSFRGGTEDFGKYCALRTVSIWDKDSSEPIESSVSDLASLNWNANKDLCKKEPDKCSSAGGETKRGCVNGILTAIGCVHTKLDEFVKDFMKFALGISGGLAFLMMLLGAFQMVTSAGNPDTLKSGQDRLTSAVIGLLMVIFATLLLQIIGVNILGIFPP